MNHQRNETDVESSNAIETTIRSVKSPPQQDHHHVTSKESDPLLFPSVRDGDKTEHDNPLKRRLNEDESKTSARADALDILSLAMPIFVAMVSWIGMKTTDSALLGHVGASALSAAALSDLYTMCTGVLVQGRVLGILCSQAVGAGNPKLAGIYLQVSYFVLSIVSIFVIVAWNFTERIWIWFGEDPQISQNAGYYARILSLSIPAQIAFSQLSQFFSSQRILHPEVTASSIALAINLVLGLILVLGLGIPNFAGYQFKACPIVTTIVVYCQIFAMWYVYCHIKQLHRPCWDGWSFRNNITTVRIRTFSELYFPAAFGTASDFWRMGVIGAMAANIGEEEVGVFNTSYRVIWIVLTLTNAIASAAGIKMGMRLGKGDPNGAKRSGYVGIGLSLLALVVLSFAMSWKIRAFGRIFTEDEVFLGLLEESKWPFVATLFFMNLAVAIEKIPISMGRTTEVFWLGFVGSWFGQVPGAYFLTRYWRYDLVGLYTGVALGYVLLVILYTWISVTSDWKKYSDIAIQRSEAVS